MKKASLSSADAGLRRKPGGQAAGTAVPAGVLADPVENEFQRLKTAIHGELIESLDLSRIGTMDEPRLRTHIWKTAEALLRSRRESLSAVDEERLIDELMAESFGLGPLEPYMQDPDVTDIMVNGPYEVYVERLGRLQETNTVFADDQHLLQIIQRVVGRVGRRIDTQNPMVDARLPDGSRVNAVIPPLSLNGPSLSIRRFGHTPLDMSRLMAYGSICPAIVAFLKTVVEGRANLMISGGAGSGKTTLLNNLSAFVPADERLVSVEDSAELQLQRKHVVRLETRIANFEGQGEIRPRDLVRNALRMRPDRIILGEVRGEEALDMLQAMNTGHEGSLTTIHANDARDALSRLEVMVNMAGFELPVSVVRQYIASAITILVHLARLKGGVRRVMRVAEITGLHNGDYQIQDIFRFQQQGLDEQGQAKGRFYATGNIPVVRRRLHEVGIEVPEEWFEQRPLDTLPLDEPSSPEVVA